MTFVIVFRVFCDRARDTVYLVTDFSRELKELPPLLAASQTMNMLL